MSGQWSSEDERPRPGAYLVGVIAGIANHLSNQTEELLPWNWRRAVRGRKNERHDVVLLYVTRLDADPAIWQRIGFCLKFIFACAQLGENVGRIGAGHAKRGLYCRVIGAQKGVGL